MIFGKRDSLLYSSFKEKGLGGAFRDVIFCGGEVIRMENLATDALSLCREGTKFCANGPMRGERTLLIC